MEIVAPAVAVILLVVVLVVWLFVRHPRPPTVAPPEGERPSGLTTDQVRAILQSTITVTVTGSTRRERYDEDYPTLVVGESHYQAEIRAIAEAHPDRGRLEDSAECEALAILAPEPGNPYDANAVTVEIDGRHVGYLSRADAAAYRSLVGLGRTPTRALIVGGWDRGPDDRGFYGVRLALKMESAAIQAPTGSPDVDQPVDEAVLLGQLEPRDDPAFPVDVMGEVRYQHALKTICAGRIQDGSVVVTPATCIPEGEGVRVEIGGMTVGYLTSDPAWIYRMTMDGAASECRARIYGGQDHGMNTNAGHFGVRLDLALRDLDPEIAPHRQAADYPCEVAGESNHQAALRSIIRRRTASKPPAWVPLVMASLQPDGSDPQRVHVLIEGEVVGYLGKVAARHYCASQNAPAEVPARITEGQAADGRTRYGVTLELAMQ